MSPETRSVAEHPALRSQQMASLVGSLFIRAIGLSLVGVAGLISALALL